MRLSSVFTGGAVLDDPHAFSETLEWFWVTIDGFTREERTKLLQFITGSGVLPAGGFGDLSPRLNISPKRGTAGLPTSHTCFNQLCLPVYTSMEQLHDALVIAISEGNEGFGMV